MRFAKLVKSENGLCGRSIFAGIMSHSVVSADCKPKRIATAIKANATRKCEKLRPGRVIEVLGCNAKVKNIYGQKKR